MTKTAQQQVLEAVKSRTEGGRFGYGITTADRYVGDVAKCTDAACFKRFGNVDTANIVKDATNKLVYCDEKNTFGEKFTSGNWKSTLPTHVHEKLEKEVQSSVAMVFKNVITSKSEDRDRDVLWTGGAQPDLKMPFLWQHIHTLPIGKMLMIDEHTDNILKAWTVLFDMNELTHDAAILIENDALRISHGFIPKQISERSWQKDDPDERMPGFDIKTFEIMEESGVSVPSNVDAIIETYASEKLKSDVVKTWSKSYYDSRSKVFPGANFDDDAHRLVAGLKMIGSTVNGLPIDDLVLREQGKEIKSGCACDTKTVETVEVVKEVVKEVPVVEAKDLENGQKRRKGVYVELKGSFEYFRQHLNGPVRKKVKDSVGSDDCSVYIEGTFDKHVIVEVYDWDDDTRKYYQVDYKVNDDGIPVPDGVVVEVDIQSGVVSKSGEDMKLNQTRSIGLKGLCRFLKEVKEKLSEEDQAELEKHAAEFDGLLTDNGKEAMWAQKQSEGGEEENPGEGGDAANPGVEDTAEDDGGAQPTGEGEETVTPKSFEFKDAVAFLAAEKLTDEQAELVKRMIG